MPGGRCTTLVNVKRPLGAQRILAARQPERVAPTHPLKGPYHDRFAYRSTRGGSPAGGWKRRTAARRSAGRIGFVR